MDIEFTQGTQLQEVDKEIRNEIGNNRAGGDRIRNEITTEEEKEKGITNFLDKNKFPTREIWADKFTDEKMKELTDKLKTLSKEDKIEYGKSISFISGGDFEVAFRSLIPKEDNSEIDKRIIKDEQEKRKINIEIPGNDNLISKFSDKIAEIIEEKDKIFYRQDIKESVEIIDDGFNIIRPARFITLIEKYFVPYTYSYGRHGKFEVEKSISQQTASIVLASSNFQDNIKNIKRIFPVPFPIFHNEKLTFAKKGFDSRFNSWLNKNTPKIKEDMTLKEAKKIFNKIYGEFCFEKSQDKTNAIAGLITPFLRGLYSSFNIRSPMFCYMANRERAGKDYCAGITGLVLEGYNVEESPLSSGEFRASGANDELRKKLTASFVAGKKRLHFANNKGMLNNATLEGFLTNTNYSDRLLGKNENITFSNEIDVSISGNFGMTFTADLANRSRFINLFLDIENANDRDFKTPNLHKWVLDNRGLILSAIFSLIKNWVDNGKPKGKISFASFPEWADICGGIMECAELGNPCEKDETINSGSLDPETADMKELFEVMFEQKPNVWLNKQDIREAINESDTGLFSYIDWSNKADQTKFGKQLGRFVGRFLSKIKLEDDGNKRTARRRYRFFKIKLEEKVKPQKTLSISTITKEEKLILSVLTKDTLTSSMLIQEKTQMKEKCMFVLLKSLKKKGVIDDPKKFYYQII